MQPIKYVEEDKEDGEYNNAITFDGEQYLSLPFFFREKPFIFRIRTTSRKFAVIKYINTHFPAHTRS